jgi:hypothetical protein
MLSQGHGSRELYVATRLLRSPGVPLTSADRCSQGNHLNAGKGVEDALGRNSKKS